MAWKQAKKDKVFHDARDRGVTLNGIPAKVTGRLTDFPHVALLNGALSVEYSWAAVAHVLYHGFGRFTA